MPSANEPSYDLYRELIVRLRNEPQEAARFLHGLPLKYRRTLKRDIDRFETRKNTINLEYLNAVVNHFHGGYKSILYTSILQRITLNDESQHAIEAMVGGYKAYRLAKGGTGESVSNITIEKTDGLYRFTDHSIQFGMDFQYSGYVFLIRRRLHLLEVLPNGIRNIILNFVEEPERSVIQGILLSVRYKPELIPGQKEDIFAARTVFIHRDHPWYHRSYNRTDIQNLIRNEDDENGLIVA